MDLYGRIAWFNFGVYFNYPIELVASVLRPVFEFGFVVLLWSIVAASSQQQLHIQTLVAYFLLATGINNLLLFKGLKFGSFLAKEIKRGRISQALIMPVNPLWYELSRRLGDRGVNFCTSILFVVAGLLLQPPTSWLGWALFLLYLPMAAVISLSINILIGTMAFYTTESAGFRNASKHVISVLSGATVPLYLFPGILKTAAVSLPFATAVYGPAHAVRITQMSTEVWIGLGGGLFWSIFLLWLSLTIWRRGLKNYEAIGI